MRNFDTTLYFITDSTNYTEEEFLRRVEEALKGGVTLLQLREKNRSTREYIDLAEKVHSIARKYNVPLIIDNTFATPVNCRPFEFGADIVTHSTTKYIDGHACAIGGVVIDSGNFNWNNGKFPGLTTPDDSYHGITYTERFGNAAYITKCMAQLSPLKISVLITMT